MNAQNKSSQNFFDNRLNNLPSKITLAWLLGFLALAVSGWLGRLSEEYWGIGQQLRYGLQAIIMSSLVVTGVLLLRYRVDRGFPKSIGVGKLWQALIKFALGISLIFLPLILTLSFTALFGWGVVNFNANDSIISKLAVGIGIVFLFEALPEELLFRGYIYSNLNIRFKRWVSALATIGLFVLLPLLLVPIQKYVFGMDINIGGSDSITFSYIINMIFFGAFVQYLRILTNSIWTGIGFHLAFVYINQLIGLEANRLIQITDFTSEAPAQITFISSLIIIFILLLLYPRLRKRKIGWLERQEQ